MKSHANTEATRRRWWSIIKRLGVTAACTLALAAVMASFGSDGDVKESRADIVTFGFAPETNTAKFHDSLLELGHPQPRALELNGNRIFFSTRPTKMEPRQAMLRYQEQFVNAGLNQHVYRRAGYTKIMQRKREMIAGGVVPIHVSDDRIMMAGTQTKSGTRDPIELLQEYKHGQSAAHTFGAYRWVEIMREPESSEALVIASWSDENFDYAKMQPTSGDRVQREVDQRIPICPGCTLVNQFRDVAEPGFNQSYIFTSYQSAEQLAGFYRRSLETRGWKPRSRASILDKLVEQFSEELPSGRTLELVRDDLTVTVLISQDGAQASSVRIEMFDTEFANRGDDSERK